MSTGVQGERRGALIVFEGGEGSGKSTQLRRVSATLARRGVSHLCLREPGGTPLGTEVRRVLLDRASDIAHRAEALLFMASRAQLVEREVRPALDRGDLVLLDRFFLSTYAYQIAGHGLPEDEVRAANRFATAGLVPDLTLLLSFPVTEGLARAARRAASHDRIEAMGEAFHRRVAAAFGTFADPSWQSDHPECGPIVAVDAEGREEEVAARVTAALAARWPGTFPPVGT
ncbi:MAG: dTMP kinase [Gemmatimonadaceae bacterium]|nr:dTMP kinase [Gemmatimonadaceae bacterium]NUP56910.1 dTMP kinase [Gemmatimonadaceae bacterium]NUP72500.1 dTMP kinase [Gemmatimonadaceae bacterium]NUR35124.1 dTMP kinase [Gemmatimonadaceae bacterium]NUS33744.1 dTMP kinase [Gemmatimonadaceae bacterium]